MLFPESSALSEKAGVSSSGLQHLRPAHQGIKKGTRPITLGGFFQKVLGHITTAPKELADVHKIKER